MTNFRLALVVAIALIGGPLVAQADGGRGHHGGGRHHGGFHGGHHGFHGHHRHHGFHSGVFLSFGPIWYPGYYYHYPRPIVAPPAAYVEQLAPQDQYYWYYCPDAQGYYPYVSECPSGWLQVVPQASPPSPPR